MKLDSIKKIIETNALGLASVGPDGRPHNIAVACCQVEGNKIIISNSHIRRTIENIAISPQVALVVWNKDWEKTCVGFEILGRATNHDHGEWLDYVRQLPDNEGYDIKSAIVVEVEKIIPLQC